MTLGNPVRAADLAPIACYTEHEAAKVIGCSYITLKQERARGNIDYTLIVMRKGCRP